MREFDLVSINWDTVRLLQAGQFKQETFYHEELVRWTLQRSGIFGVIRMEEDSVSLPTPEGDRMFSVRVRGCSAVGAMGSIIEVPEAREDAIHGLVEANGTTVPLYVGVALTTRRTEPSLNSSKDTGLIHCGGLRPKYMLATDDSDGRYDWLQIAQFEKTSTGVRRDPHFIPECMFLSSHPAQWNLQRKIQSLANQALTHLEENATAAPQVFAPAMALAGSLGPAARRLDGRQHPRAYIEMLACLFAAQQSQLRILPKPNLTVYQQALDQLSHTLEYLEEEWAPGLALAKAVECFERLLRLYPELLKFLGGLGPMRPVMVAETDTVVPAQLPASSGLPPDQLPPPKRPGIFRR